MWTWSRKELKTNAKAALKRSFWKDLLALIIVGLIAGAISYCVFLVINAVSGGKLLEAQEALTNIQNGASQAEVQKVMNESFGPAYSIYNMVNSIISLFIVVPLGIGTYRFFQVSRSGSASFSELFVPLKKFFRIGLIMMWLGIKVFLWSLLFIIPGIIKSYEYSQVPLILAENPSIKRRRAFQISKAMTKGNKWHLFVLELSFILWVIGTVCTCGLLGIYFAPYYQATFVEAYYKMKAKALADGKVTLEELPNICLSDAPVQAEAIAAAQNNVVPAAVATAAAATAVAAANNTEEAAPAVEEAAAVVEAAPVEAAPAEEAVVAEAAVEEVPTEEAAPAEDEEAPAEEAPAEEAPAEEAPAEEAPAEEAPAEEAPAEETPAAE